MKQRKTFPPFSCEKWISVDLWREDEQQRRGVGELAPGEGGEEEEVRREAAPRRRSDDVEGATSGQLRSQRQAQEAALPELRRRVPAREAQVQAEEDDQHLTCKAVTVTT